MRTHAGGPAGAVDEVRPPVGLEKVSLSASVIFRIGDRSPRPGAESPTRPSDAHRKPSRLGSARVASLRIGRPWPCRPRRFAPPNPWRTVRTDPRPRRLASPRGCRSLPTRLHTREQENDGTGADLRRLRGRHGSGARLPRGVGARRPAARLSGRGSRGDLPPVPCLRRATERCTGIDKSLAHIGPRAVAPAHTFRWPAICGLAGTVIGSSTVVSGATSARSRPPQAPGAQSEMCRLPSRREPWGEAARCVHIAASLPNCASSPRRAEPGYRQAAAPRVWPHAGAARGVCLTHCWCGLPHTSAARRRAPLASDRAPTSFMGRSRPAVARFVLGTPTAGRSSGGRRHNGLMQSGRRPSPIHDGSRP
jgi:hypothetical protein